MGDVNAVAVVVSAAAVVVTSTIWYSVLGTQLATLHEAYAEAAASNGRPPAWKVGLELLRSLVVASVVAGLADQLELSGGLDGAKLGLVLWVGFPVVLWTGAVMWEKVRPRLAVIHAGDWLLKLLLISVIVTVWD